jgi:hypothetical protein
MSPIVMRHGLYITALYLGIPNCSFILQHYPSYFLSLANLQPLYLDSQCPILSTYFHHDLTTTALGNIKLTAMALTKKKEASTSKEPATKQSKDRVVKRPGRGFHRFRSGILNVTPKGGEKELSVFAYV